MKNIFLVLPFVCLITACSDPSVEDLLEDQELLGKTMQECVAKTTQGEEDNSEKCKNATEAYKKLAKATYDMLTQQNH